MTPSKGNIDGKTSPSDDSGTTVMDYCKFMLLFCSSLNTWRFNHLHQFLSGRNIELAWGWVRGIDVFFGFTLQLNKRFLPSPLLPHAWHHTRAIPYLQDGEERRPYPQPAAGSTAPVLRVPSCPPGSVAVTLSLSTAGNT